MFEFALQNRPQSAKVPAIFGCPTSRHHDANVRVPDGKQRRGRLRKNRSWENRAWALIVLIAVAALFSNSAHARSFQLSQSYNPVPYVSIISPLSVLPERRAEGFNLTVTGANFISSSVVYWDSTALVTTYVNRAKLIAVVPPSLITTEGTGWITVFNPTPRGGRSNIAYLQVGHPVATYNPTMFSLLPTGSAWFYQHGQGDFNGDGKMDLIGVDYSVSGVLVFLGNGDGTFQPGVSSPDASGEADVASGDLNGDGKLDLVLSASNKPFSIEVLLGNGDGTFQTGTTYGPSLGGGNAPILADVNGDGYLDILVPDGNAIEYYQGNGDGTFQAPVSIGTFGASSTIIAVGDFDGDGILDIAAGNNVNSTVALFKGVGDGTFLAAQNFTGQGFAEFAATGDFNEDGWLDFVGGGGGSNSTLLLNAAGSGFSPSTLLNITSGGLGTVGVADLNGDGHADLIGNDTGGSSAMTVSLGTGNGTFSAFSSYGAGNYFNYEPITIGNFVTGGGLGFAISDDETGAVDVFLLSVKVSPTPLPFGNVAINSTPAPQVLTITNNATTTAALTSSVISGTNSSEFVIAGTTCGTTLASGASCTSSIAFTPLAAGARTATFTETDTGAGVTQTAALTGAGVSASAVLLTPSAAAFTSQLLTTTSAPQVLTLQNTGSLTLNIASIVLGGTNAADFAETSTCGATLAVSASCTIAVTFTPSAIGARSATVTLTDNALDSPQTLLLSGTGVTSNPVPTLGMLSQTSATVGGATFTLTLTGSNFVAGTLVEWNGVALATTVSSGTQLTAIVPATDIAAGGTAAITVLNPAPGGGASTAITFTINDPLPTLSLLSPTTADAGGAAFTLTLTGTNFMTGTVVKWNGVALTTTIVSATQATALVPVGDLATGGAISVTVFNPLPGGGTSAALTVTIADYALSSPTPAQTVAAGQPATFAISTATVGGAFPNPMTFTVTGLPAGAAATFNPSSVTPGASTTMKVTTTARTASALSRNPFNQNDPLSPPSLPAWPAAANLSILLATLLAAFGFARLRYRLPPTMAPVAALITTLIVTVAFIAGCGSTSRPAPTGTPAGTYVLTVTGTSGTVARSTTVTMIVQ